VGELDEDELGEAREVYSVSLLVARKPGNIVEEGALVPAGTAVVGIRPELSTPDMAIPR